MSAIGAGGGLAAQGLSAQGLGNGIKAESKVGPAGAKAAKDANAKGGHQAKGSDFGRDGALSRGHGFSQRDAFTPAKQAQKPQQAGGAHKTDGAKQAQEKQAHQKDAKQADPATLHKQQAQKPQAEQKLPQEQQKQQVKESDATRAAEAASMRRIEQLAEMAKMSAMKAMVAMRDAEADELKETLVKMWKKFLEWLKEMDAIFLAPSPR
jgi:hypothetical protein